MAAPLAAVPLTAIFPLDLEAKKPGARHCYRQVCVRVRSVKETEKLVGETLTITTSHYGDPSTDRFNTGRYTSNGERFSADDGSRTASADFPDGTELLLRNPENGRVSHVRVNDFGPFMGTRRLDVTEQVARDLDFFHRGVVDLEVTVLAAPTSDDHVNLYRRNRKTPETGGFMGRYSEVEVAGLAHELIESSRRKLMAHDSAVLAFISSIVPPRRKPDNQTLPEIDAPAGLAMAMAEVGADADRPAGEGFHTSLSQRIGFRDTAAEVQAAPQAVLLAPAPAPELLDPPPAATRAIEVAAHAHRPILISATNADIATARSRLLQSFKKIDDRQVIAAHDIEDVLPAKPAAPSSTPTHGGMPGLLSAPIATRDDRASFEAGQDGEQTAAAAVREPRVAGLEHVGFVQPSPRSVTGYAGQRQMLAAPHQIQFLALLAAILAATVSIYAFGNIALRSRAGGLALGRVPQSGGKNAAQHEVERHVPRWRASPLRGLAPAIAPRGHGDKNDRENAAEPCNDNTVLARSYDFVARFRAHAPAATEDQQPHEVESSPVVEAPRSLPSAAHETVIGEGVTIESDIVSDEAVYIAGEVIGNVSGRRVELAAGAIVSGHIAADHAIVDGCLIGNVDARELSVLARAEMSGNARIEVLSVEPGARVDVAFAFLRPDVHSSQPKILEAR